MNNSEFTPDDLANFCTAYIIENNEDPHERFAELMDISRRDAKVLCYKIMYSRVVTKSLIDSLQASLGEQL